MYSQFYSESEGTKRQEVRSYARVLYENYRTHVMASRKQEMPEWSLATTGAKREFILEARQELS